MTDPVDIPEDPIRIPEAADLPTARITAFTAWLAAHKRQHFPDYESLWRFSTEETAAFWDAIREYFDIPMKGHWSSVLADPAMPGARWYPGATINYVEQVFRHSTPARPAIVSASEDGSLREITWADLENDVSALAAWLRDHGIGRGDRVVAYLPNTPEAVVAFLAVASVGAIWSLCSQDMGVPSVLDRFRQIEPKVLIAASGYVHGGKYHDRTDTLSALMQELPTVLYQLRIKHSLDTSTSGAPSRVTDWQEVLRNPAPLRLEQVPFDHPLWIVYSSGTTGLPKPIVHGHGGIVLEHVKLGALHNNLHPHDRFFWFSSSGWIMWNIQVGVLLLGTTLCLFEGSPSGPNTTTPDLTTLWRFAARVGVTFFGAGAAYYAACLKADLQPALSADLSRLRSIGSTGSPLSPEAERWIYKAIRPTIWVAPVSGGTDFASAFIGSLPTLPSYLGEMQCRCLGARVEAWSEQGQPLIDQVGELVCTAPMPSMPLYFWNDPEQRRYRESYFDMFPGIWRHGDWIRLIPHSQAYGVIVYGRSDATINRHGIRMGTADIYRAVEAIPDVLDSLVVDLEYLGREPYMPLFVVLRAGQQLTPDLVGQINSEIRRQLSARHVPNDIFQVTEIPRTITGKKLELPVKKLLLGMPADRVLNRDALANPASVDWFVDFAEAHNAGRQTSQ